MGWLALAAKSTMARRRNARPACRSGDNQSPTPSGPRWATASRIRPRTSASTRWADEVDSHPTIPHIGLLFSASEPGPGSKALVSTRRAPPVQGGPGAACGRIPARSAGKSAEGRLLQVAISGGEVRVVEVPEPLVRGGAVLVRTSHSLISAGTEAAPLASGGRRESLALKALRNPAL